VFVPAVLGLSQLLQLPHECSGSVVHSAGHDVVLTAAHCVTGPGLGYEFAPGYHDGVSPYGRWTVRRAYVNAAWQTSHDPQHDYAFLEVAPSAGRNIEDVLGANRLGTAPQAGQSVTVDAYLAGVNDKPITCVTTVYYTEGYPSFDCDGFGDGTSGGPWLSGHTVVGVIGGRQQGGCTPSTSFSSAFGADVIHDWQRASAGGPSDFVLPALISGC
jgi:V8-like Glu-specific endopeptidase